MTQGFKETKDSLTDQRTAHVNNANKNKTPLSKVSINPQPNILELSPKKYGKYGYTVNEIEFLNSWVTGNDEEVYKNLSNKLVKLINSKSKVVSIKLNDFEIALLKRIEPVFNTNEFFQEALLTQLLNSADNDALDKATKKAFPTETKANIEYSKVVLKIEKDFEVVIKKLNKKIRQLTLTNSTTTMTSHKLPSMDLSPHERVQVLRGITLFKTSYESANYTDDSDELLEELANHFKEDREITDEKLFKELSKLLEVDVLNNKVIDTPFNNKVIELMKNFEFYVK